MLLRYIEIRYNCKKPFKKLEKILKESLDIFGYKLVYKLHNKMDSVRFLEFDKKEEERWD